jgi:aryl-alcohol dehydrogenase-like predicted oxidoreductase
MKEVEIGLGTVQLGLPYGGRRNGMMMDERTAFGILHCAVDRGIKFYDTASSYGKSEERLGRFAIGQVQNLRLATKMPTVDAKVWGNSDAYLQFLEKTLEESLIRLNVDFIQLLHFHQCDCAFLSSHAFKEALRYLAASPKVGAIGVSVYSLEQARLAVRHNEVAWLQVPVNIVDIRFLRQDLTTSLRARGGGLIARSIFLQGVLNENIAIPDVKRGTELGHLRQQCLDVTTRYGMTLSEAALAFIFIHCRPYLDVALIGADDEAQLLENIEGIRQAAGLNTRIFESNEFTAIRQLALASGIIDPTTWNVT